MAPIPPNRLPRTPPMLNPAPGLTLMVLVDALRWDYVTRTRYLRQLASSGATGALREAFGFVPRAAYFGGLSASQYGFTNMYCLDPVHSPFQIADALPTTGIGAAAERAIGLRPFIETVARERLPSFAKHYVSTLEIPLEFLPFFDPVEKRAPWDPQVGYPSLFSQLNALNLPWYQCSWPESTRLPDPSDTGIVRTTLAQLHPHHRLAYVHLQELDGVGHAHGPNSTALQRCLDRTDALCEELIETLRQRYGSLNLLLFGDHGMVRVTRTLDLAPVLQATGLQFGADYAYFLDSTMARFWFFHARARPIVQQALHNLEGGQWLSDSDLVHHGIAGCDPRNAEAIFLAHPGVLLFPNFFQSQGEPIRGMHGYHPHCPDNLGFILIHRPDVPSLAGQNLGLVDPPSLYPTLCHWLEVNPHPTSPAPVLVTHQTPPPRFTQHPHPQADLAVQSILQQILSAIHDQVGHPQAVVLTGSFGRGEGGVVQDAQGHFQPINDLDLLVVDPKDLRQDLVPLGPQLAARFGLDFVDLGYSDGQWRQLPLTLFHYDLKHGSQILEGDPRILDPLPSYASADLPPCEIVRLLLNRSAGILSGLSADLLQGFPLIPSQARYLTIQIAKAWMALGDWYLIRWEAYDSSYRQRRQRLEWLGPGAGLPENILQPILAAYAFKTLPNLAAFDPLLHHLPTLANTLLRTLIPAINWMAETHATHLDQAIPHYLTSTAPDPFHLHQDHAACLNQPNLQPLFRPSPATSHSFRHLVMAAIPCLLEATTTTQPFAPAAHRVRSLLEPAFLLPPSSGHASADWEALRAFVIRAWFALCH